MTRTTASRSHSGNAHGTFEDAPRIAATRDYDGFKTVDMRGGFDCSDARDGFEDSGSARRPLRRRSPRLEPGASEFRAPAPS